MKKLSDKSESKIEITQDLDFSGQPPITSASQRNIFGGSRRMELDQIIANIYLVDKSFWLEFFDAGWGYQSGLPDTDARNSGIDCDDTRKRLTN
jgi:hypothetical protein